MSPLNRSGNPPKDQLDQVLRLHSELNKTRGTALGDREIVQITLKLANDYADVEPADLISPRGFISLGSSPDLTAFFNKMPPTVLRSSWEKIAGVRQKFRRRLDLIYADREAARTAIGDEIGATLDKIIAIPRLTWTGAELRTELLYATTDPEARCNYALMLLLDEKREIWRSLKLCALHGCNRYFLASDGGGRPRLYCNGEHQQVASKLTGAVRTERWRKNKATKARKAK